MDGLFFKEVHVELFCKLNVSRLTTLAFLYFHWNQAFVIGLMRCLTKQQESLHLS